MPGLDTVNATADVNLFKSLPWLKSMAKSGVRLAPFAVPVAVGAAWLVYPTLTPEFKGRWGLGPKIETE